MRDVRFTLLALMALAGCDTISKTKVDNPVVGPPPPRMSRAELAALNAQNDSQHDPRDPTVEFLPPGEVVPVGLSRKDDSELDDLADSHVVATVDIDAAARARARIPSLRHDRRFGDPAPAVPRGRAVA